MKMMDSDPCQPIGCDNGIHLEGCGYQIIDTPEVNDSNDYGLCLRTGALIFIYVNPQWRTKQSAYRAAAYLKLMADLLPDEDVPSTWEQVENAISK